jgi:cell division protein FtsI (penicillin-binding protein 3)
VNEKRLKAGKWRSVVVLGALALGALLLTARAVELHVLDRDFLQNQGQSRHLRVLEVPAHRGMILDRNGEPMAVSTPVDSIWAHPGELLAVSERLPALADVLGIERAWLERRLGDRLEREFVYLRRHLAPEEADAVMALGVPGVYTQREYRRYYPAAEVAAHVLGFTNIDDRGQEGMELAYDGWLRGEPGAKRVLRDRLGRIIEDVENIRSPRPGENLKTTIDLRLQYVAYRELKAAVREHGAQAGSIVLIDPRNGDILAVASQPGYNPNNRRQVSSGQMRNRAIVDLLEPGSAIKPFIAAAILDDGVFPADRRFDTSPGRFARAGHTVRDVRDFGSLDMHGILQKSSNVGATMMALEATPESLWQQLGRLGIGQPTASGFPGEGAGRLPHWQDWREIGHVTMAYGYGLSMTPLQLAAAYAAIASDGVMPELSLVSRSRAQAGRRVMSKDAARTLRDMLESVIEPGGTGTRAAVDGYSVAGKTGTVKKAGPRGYSEDEYLSVFAGMVPASSPRLVGVVVLDNPRGRDFYGGAVAAPVFGRVMSDAMRLLDIPRDRLGPSPDVILVEGGGSG